MSVTHIEGAETLQAARQVMKTLRPTEDAIDQSIIENAKLVGAMIQARLVAKASPELGHDAVTSSIAMLAALTEARGLGITCHRQLAVARDTLGYSGSDLGCSVTKVSNRAQAPALAMVAA